MLLHEYHEEWLILPRGSFVQYEIFLPAYSRFGESRLDFARNTPFFVSRRFPTTKYPPERSGPHFSILFCYRTQVSFIHKNVLPVLAQLDSTPLRSKLESLVRRQHGHLFVGTGKHGKMK